MKNAKKATFLSIALLTISFNTPRAAEFTNTQTRYLSRMDVGRVLTQKFGFRCATGLADPQAAIFGFSDPSTGVPSFRAPSPAFVQEYWRCLEQYLPNSRIVQEAHAVAVRSIPRRVPAASAKWADLPATSKNAIVRVVVHELIGPSVLPNEVAWISSFVSNLDSQLDAMPLAHAIRAIAFNVASSEEFLTY